MSSTQWPMPFGGITCYVQLNGADDVMSLLSYLGAGCPHVAPLKHDHNIAVAFDGNRVYGSDLFGECAQVWATNYLKTATAWQRVAPEGTDAEPAPSGHG